MAPETPASNQGGPPTYSRVHMETPPRGRGMATCSFPGIASYTVILKDFQGQELADWVSVKACSVVIARHGRGPLALPLGLTSQGTFRPPPWAQKLSESGLCAWAPVQLDKGLYQVLAGFSCQVPGMSRAQCAASTPRRPFPLCSCSPAHLTAVQKETHLNPVLNGPLEA